MKHPENIPTNYESLRDSYLAVIEDIQNLKVDNQGLHLRNIKLEQELSWLKRQVFGQKSERYVPAQNGQTELTLDAAITEEQSEVETQDISYQRHVVTSAPKKGHGRLALPATLPRVDIVLEPKEDVSGMNKIGEEITETLEYKPGSFFVNRYIRPKYAKADGSGTVITAILPSRPIDKGIPGASLLAYVMISKFVDHLPLYRIANILARDGFRISLPTLCGWIDGAYNLLLPLYHKLIEETLNTDYLQADETTVKVQDEKLKGKTHQGYFWVYRNPLKKLLFFDYRETRSGSSPEETLADFEGYLQTDGYSGYGGLHKNDKIKPVACMAHARRKFFDAKENGSQKAEDALVLFEKLYAIEAKAREDCLTYEQRQAKREREARPVLDELKGWMDKEIGASLPKSQLGMAIAYSLNRWNYLQEYINDGRLEIDNNLIENAIRPVALGRKNWLFAGSHEGAYRAALIYSLFATCKANDVEPHEYIRNLLTVLPDYSSQKLAELLPTKKIIEK